MSHYFITDKNLNEDENEIKVTIKNKQYHFFTQAGVFSKNNIDYGTKVLLDNVTVPKDTKNIADVGCGYGVIGIILANENPNAKVNMYDINERAISLTKKNAIKNNVANVAVSLNNALDNVLEKFELIITNPPIRAGKEIIFKIYEQAYERLNLKGVFYCVIQKKQGAPSTVKKLEELFQKVEIVDKNGGYWIIRAEKH